MRENKATWPKLTTEQREACRRGKRWMDREAMRSHDELEVHSEMTRQAGDSEAAAYAAGFLAHQRLVAKRGGVDRKKTAAAG